MSTSTRQCPECGACVEVLAGRWLTVHRDRRGEHAQLVLGRSRCLGSLLMVAERRPDDDRSTGAR